MDKTQRTTAASDTPSPSCIRFKRHHITRLESLANRTNLSRSGLVLLAVEYMLEHETSTGNLLVPQSATSTNPA